LNRSDAIVRGCKVGWGVVGCGKGGRVKSRRRKGTVHPQGLGRDSEKKNTTVQGGLWMRRLDNTRREKRKWPMSNVTACEKEQGKKEEKRG